MNKRELTAAVEDLQAWRRSMEPAVTMDEAAEVLLAEAADTLAVGDRVRTLDWVRGHNGRPFLDEFPIGTIGEITMDNGIEGHLERYRVHANGDYWRYPASSLQRIAPEPAPAEPSPLTAEDAKWLREGDALIVPDSPIDHRGRVFEAAGSNTVRTHCSHCDTTITGPMHWFSLPTATAAAIASRKAAAQTPQTAAERLRAATYQLDGETDAEYADRLAEMLCRLANVPPLTAYDYPRIGLTNAHQCAEAHNAGIIAAQEAALAAIEVPGEQPTGGKDGQ